MTLKRRSFAGLAIVASFSLLLAACSWGSSDSARTSTTADAEGSTVTTRANNRTRPNRTRPNQTRPNRTRPNQLLGTSLSGVACPEASATRTGRKALGNKGTQTRYTTGDDYLTVISDCTAALQEAGWTVVGGDGGDNGDYGGGGLGGTKGAANVQVEAGDNGSITYVYVCYWPGSQSDDNCGDKKNNDNDQDGKKNNDNGDNGDNGGNGGNGNEEM